MDLSKLNKESVKAANKVEKVTTLSQEDLQKVMGGISIYLLHLVF